MYSGPKCVKKEEGAEEGKGGLTWVVFKALALPTRTLLPAVVIPGSVGMAARRASL
jgi:hypothetical protein